MDDNNRPMVLVIDDERALADLYSAWLSVEYEVKTAYDGAAAIEAVDESVDVVLLDRRMPGLSGDDVLAEVREQGIDARVVMVTAVIPDVDVVEMGFDDYLVKPVSSDDLVETIERMLRVSGFDGELQTYYSLVNKRALLEAEHAEQSLAESEEHASLCRQIDALENRLDDLGTEFETADFDSLFRGLSAVDDSCPVSPKPATSR